LSESSIKLGLAQNIDGPAHLGNSLPTLALPTLLPPSTQQESDTTHTSRIRGQSSIQPSTPAAGSLRDPIATSHSNTPLPISHSQPSLKTNQVLIKQGLEQSPPINRPLFFANGVGGSNLSSVISSRSPSVQSSLSNLQDGFEFENKLKDSSAQMKVRVCNFMFILIVNSLFFLVLLCMLAGSSW